MKVFVIIKTEAYSGYERHEEKQVHSVYLDQKKAEEKANELYDAIKAKYLLFYTNFDVEEFDVEDAHD